MLRTLPIPILREVLMRHTRASRSIEQLGLFSPRARTPQWRDLPSQVRCETLALLVRLLRGHRRGAQQAEGARDE